MSSFLQTTYVVLSTDSVASVEAIGIGAITLGALGLGLGLVLVGIIRRSRGQTGR